MFAPAHLKRRRSPSPVGFESPDLGAPSPLDVLAKRRRRQPGAELDTNSGDYFSHSHVQGHSQSGAPNNDHPDLHAEPDPSSSALYAERRRTKQWERLNAPRPPLSYTGQFQPHIDYTPPHSHSHSHSQPQAMARSYSEPEHHLPSPTHLYPHSQPLPHHPMSSSPIRHEPFGSSPFRSSSTTSMSVVTPSGFGSSSTRVEQDVQEEDDSMDPEEMRRTWGEQYTRQNELLHSIHRERRQAQIGHDSPITPSIHTPQHYRTAHYSSSPFEHPSSVRSYAARDAMMMEQDFDDVPMNPRLDGVETAADLAVRQRYEDANRLLAELEVVRRSRWRD